MTTMVEKVAKVIYEAHGFSYDGRTINAMGEAYGQWAKTVNAARAAIEAMMVPTEEMLSDEICAHLESDMDHMTPMGSLNRAYGAMIEAALKEQL